MTLTEYFLKHGKKNASKSKALRLIEKIIPKIDYQNHIRPSMFLNNTFEKIEKKFKPNNALRGSIFEYLVMCMKECLSQLERSAYDRTSSSDLFFNVFYSGQLLQTL